MAKVLITDGNYPCTLGIVRSLSLEGHKVDCIGGKLSLCRFSKYLNKVSYLSGEFNQAKFYKFINFLKYNKYDYLIAIGAHSVNLISKNRDQIKKYVDFNIPPNKILDLCFSKKEMYAYAKKIGVRSPKKYSKEDIKMHIDNKIQLPDSLVIKSNNELFEKEVYYVENSKNYFKKNNVSYLKIVQERIKGDSYGFFGIYNNGILKSYFMHKRIREEPLTGGSSTYAKSIFDQEIYDTSLKLLNDLNWNGVVMVEYKRCKKNGKLYLIEINPKFWGSHDLAISAGRNFASMLLHINNDKIFKQLKEYKKEIYYQWPVTDLRTCLFNLMFLRRFFSDFFNKNTLNNFDSIDTLPTIHMICWGLLKPLWKIIKSSLILKFFYKVKCDGIYFALIRTINEITGIPNMSHSIITDKLATGMQPSWIGLFLLKMYGFKNILNLRAEINLKKIPTRFINSYYFPVIEFDSPSVEQLFIICELIEDVIDKKNEKLYIHCREGISRAPMIAAAFIINKYGLSKSEALNKIIKRRPFIKVLDNQKRVLSDFEKLIKNK